MTHRVLLAAAGLTWTVASVTYNPLTAWLSALLLAAGLVALIGGITHDHHRR